MAQLKPKQTKSSAGGEVSPSCIVEFAMWCAADPLPRTHITAGRMSENDSLHRIQYLQYRKSPRT